jgi:pyruvate dehydrogenase E2 component (dihydrolipoamide acetyltransferase)
MALEIRVPRLGWTMEQGTFGGWLKKDGEAVKEGVPLFTVEGDKALQEVEAIGDGVLRIAPECPAPGATVDVGALLGYLVAPGEDGPFQALPSGAETAAGDAAAMASPSPALPATPTNLPSSPPTLPAAATFLPVSPTIVPASPTNLPSSPTILPAIPTILPATPRILPGAPAAAASARAAPAGGPAPGPAPPLAPAPGVPFATASGPAFGPAAAHGPPAGSRQTAVTLGPGTVPPSISPRALRLAGELGIDWTCLRSSSRSGRIVERDIREAARPATPARKTIALSSLRKIIAERMHEGASATAPVTLAVEADATELVASRERLKAAAAAGAAPTFTDIFIVLVAKVLALHPLLNARFEGGEIVLEDAVHMAVAVDAPDGLLVPVLRDAGRKTLQDVARETKALIEKARARKLAPEEMQGGTFTLTNLGMYAVDAFTPILNPPQCAILGIGRIVRKPAVHGDTVVPRQRVTLSLTFDHRVVDGAPAARFLSAIVERLESPGAGLEG